MKKYFLLTLILSGVRLISYGQNAQTNDLKIVFIRHGEKPEKGNNLTCKGLNRSLLLPKILHEKFGTPDFVYVPSLKLAEKTTHARMFETIAPMAVQYNLDINSKFAEDDSAGIANDIIQKKGTVLVVWEHRAISGIMHSLGVNYTYKWSGDDFNTIFIVTFKDGKATLTKDSEGLTPSDDCP